MTLQNHGINHIKYNNPWVTSEFLVLEVQRKLFWNKILSGLKIKFWKAEIKVDNDLSHCIFFGSGDFELIVKSNWRVIYLFAVPLIFFYNGGPCDI